ncbi:disease resistance protein isoform X6 [Glycine max]|uniref:disease resistance protein isoform X6 n=1 Tax=Glycine max TaxID=3847 RepID=UPI0003DE91AD|nr:disease resistance protein isoform X6 [Glycine max]|eukprot:XP_006601722.1 disease resistance protein isoform X6 [Glycine max]
MIMNRKMKSTVGVCLLFLVLLEAMCCEGCWKEERDALLVLNSRFDFPLSWDGPDCCQWEGVECNSTTGRVAGLDLQLRWSFPPSNGNKLYINYSDFVVFKDLKKLDLSLNGISGCVGNEARLESLEVLDISRNYLDDAGILSCLDGLSSLKSLYLRDIGLNTSSFHVFETLSSKLRYLEVLDVSGNYLDDAGILSCLDGLSSLKSLYLADNKLNTSSFHVFETLSSKLRNLEVLDISFNYLTNDILPSLGGFTSLKRLYLAGIHLDSDLHFQGNGGFTWPTGLQALDLRENRLNNKFLPSLNGLECLKYLGLSSNQLEGSLNISGLSGLTSLEILNLSYNNISDFVVHQGLKSLRRLDALHLYGNMIDGSKLRKSLRAFSSVRMLSMGENEFKGTIVAGDFQDLSNLEELTMDLSNNMENEFFKSIGKLTSLKVLSLYHCNINGTLPHADWSKLKKLELLDLSGNKFEGPLPSSFVNMTSLQKLEISYNHFIGNFDSNIASLTSLEYFGFIENQFEVPVSFTPFANHSKIKFIHGEGNKVSLDSQHSFPTWIPKFQLQELIVSSTTKTMFLPLPNFLLYQNSLITLDFSSWKLEGDFPHWLLENNTKMTHVLFRNCSFTGTFQLPMRPLPNIWEIDVSDNIIVGQIPSNNFSSIYPNLHFLNLSRNNIQGSIPHELGQMNSLYSLDLSGNQLSGEIPKDIFGVGHQLRFLKLSNNKLEGPILNIPNGLETLLLNHNRFTGRLPSNIFNASIISLDVKNNHLVGKIPSLIKNLSGLYEICLSNNHFEGSIPLELGELEDLTSVDLSQNNFIGLVPSFANSSVAFIHLNNNRLSGLPKRMFHGKSSLVMLDLSYNEISNNLQDLIHNLSYKRLNFLLLKGNHFMGDIPKQICQLIDLNMLDLSHNNFSGVIPKCLGKMPFENKYLKSLLARFSTFDPDPNNLAQSPDLAQSPTPVSGPTLNLQEKANFTTKERTDTYIGRVLFYMSGIDLSHNKLKGNIPFELGYLTKIRALNLSHNDLTGKIPVTFSLLAQTESLDLSFNMLNSQIPPQLSMLTSLEVFSVAHNNLSGPTPDFKGQFSTFDESSYEGNPFLCGPPLPKSCNPPPTIIPNDSNTDGDNDSLLDMYVFCVSFAVSYISTLLVTAAALYINPYWRQAWFYYMELVSMNCYYFIKDNLSKVFKIGNM